MHASLYETHRFDARAVDREHRGEIVPGLQGPMSLIAPNASRSGGLHQVNQQ